MSSAPGPPYPPTGNRRRRLRRPHSMPGVVAQSVFVGALFASPSCSEGLLNPGIVVTPPKVQPVVGFFQPNGQLKAFVTAPSFSICSTGGLERRLSSSRVCGLSRYSTRTVLSVITGGDDGGDRGEGVWEPETRSEDAVEDLAGNASGLQQVVMSEDAIGAAADANERPNSHQEEPEVMEGTSTMRQSSEPAGRDLHARERKPKRPRLTGEALRDELMNREREAKKAVLEANTAYYRARAYKLIDDLKEAWDDSELSDCVRAGGLTMKGYFTISKLHDVEFALARKIEKRGQRPFKVLNINVNACGNLAWVTCVEDMRHPLKPKPSTVQLVTNVFRKTSQGWKLVRHHASHKGPDSIEGQANKAQTESVGELIADNTIRASQIAEIRRRVFNPQTDGPMIVSAASLGLNDDDDDEEEEEDERRQKDNAALDRDESLKQRIRDAFARSGVMAQDVIINSVDEVRQQDPTEKEHAAAEVASRIRKYLLNNKLITPEAAKAEDERIKAVKAKLGVDPSEGDANNSGDGEDGGDRLQEAGSAAPAEDNDGDGGEGDGTTDQGSSSESRGVTRETVQALRELARVGKITEGEKQLLFADVIRNASGGRHSTVEVAFEVLVGGESGNTFDPEECEEFAEQCKVHAAHLAEEERRSKRRWWKFWQGLQRLFARR